MGDIADWHFDMMFEEFLTDLEDCNEPNSFTCKFCKRGGFVWLETDRGWRLHTQKGELHSCKKYLES